MTARIEKPTGFFRWRAAYYADEHGFTDDLGDKYVLEQQWEDVKTGECVWRPVEFHHGK